MSKRLMTALCITAITMLVVGANASHCPSGSVHIGGSCVRLSTFGTAQTERTLESEADLAMLVNEAVANDRPIELRILGVSPGGRGPSGKSDKMVQQMVQREIQEMVKSLKRDPDSVRVIYK